MIIDLEGIYAQYGKGSEIAFSNEVCRSLLESIRLMDSRNDSRYCHWLARDLIENNGISAARKVFGDEEVDVFREKYFNQFVSLIDSSNDLALSF